MAVAVFSLGCGTPKNGAPTVAPSAHAASALGELAEPFRGAERSSLEAVMPDGVRQALSSDPAASPAELLELARRHVGLAPTPLVRSEDAESWMREMLTAMTLAERASQGDTPSSYEASALLAQLVKDVTARSQWFIVVGEQGGGAPPARVSLAALGIDPALLGKQLLFHLGRVLRHEGPPVALTSALRMMLEMDLGARRTEIAVAALLRLRQSLDATEWALVAKASAMHADPATFATRLAKAEAAIQALPAPQRRPLRAQIEIAKDRQKAVRRYAAAQGDSLAAHLERFDVVYELQHLPIEPEAKALAALAAHDGRVRARLAKLALRDAANTAGTSQLEQVETARRVLLAAPITAPSVDDARFRIGLESAALSLGDGNSMAVLGEAVDRYTQLDADGAAGLAYVARRVREVKGDKSKLGEVASVQRTFDEVTALRVAHPHNQDVVRLAQWAAMHVKDPARGVPSMRDLAGIDAAAHPELALAHASVLVSLAAATGEVSLVPMARQLLDAVPASENLLKEGKRAELLADATMVEAVSGNAELWGEVAALYARAVETLPNDRGRLGNNYAFARSKLGGANPASVDRFRPVTRGVATDNANVLALLNMAMQEPAKIPELYATLDADLGSVAAGDLSFSSILFTRWLAVHAPNAAAARKHARKVVKLRGPLAPEPKPGFPLVCVADLSVNIQIDSRDGYRFEPGAGCELWLLEGGLPSSATLAKLAR